MHRNHTQAPAGSGKYSRAALSLLLVALLSALLTTLIYQIPVIHTVDIGGYDAAYTRGFFDPQLAGTLLDGSDGSARWTKAESFLLFPQAGWPAQISIHMRARPGMRTELSILTNGVEQRSMQLDEHWQLVQVPVAFSLVKPEDTLLSIRSTTAPLSAQAQSVGVLIDRVSYVVGPAPILPAPSQLLYAVVLSLLLLTIFTSNIRSTQAAAHKPGAAPLIPQPRSFILAACLPAILLLVLYRLQTPYPYPLRGLLQTVCLFATGWLVVKHAPNLALRAAWLADVLALGGMLVWALALWNAAQAHVVRSIPGVENDFRVFATRSDLASILRADGFYNLGYPLLLWLAAPFTAHNPFLAGRLVGLLAALVVLATTWWLGRSMLGSAAALIAIAVVALSPMFVEYALYLGSDMPFAAMCLLTLALLISGGRQAGGQNGALASYRRGAPLSIPMAGICAGLAFLIRHPGLLLVAVGWISIMLSGTRNAQQPNKLGMHPSYTSAHALIHNARALLMFSLAFGLTIAPQLLVNLRDTGQPLYSQQAKNIWLAVMGDGDWGRWDEISNDIGLLDVFRQSPNRFLANWWANIRSFWGSGAEDSSEFGRAIQLRLLGFPANWLAVAGLGLWACGLVTEHTIRQTANRKPQTVINHAPCNTQHATLLILWLVLYVVAICVGFALPRFFLPLLPIYALAAASMLRWIAGLVPLHLSARLFTAMGLVLLACLWGGFNIGTSYVLRPRVIGEQLPGQEIFATAAVNMIRVSLRNDELLVVRVPPDDDEGLALSKYSAIAHRVLPADGSPADWRARGASAVLWSQRLGKPMGLGEPLWQVGPYGLYQLAAP